MGLPREGIYAKDQSGSSPQACEQAMGGRTRAHQGTMGPQTPCEFASQPGSSRSGRAPGAVVPARKSSSWRGSRCATAASSTRISAITRGFCGAGTPHVSARRAGLPCATELVWGPTMLVQSRQPRCFC